METSLEQEKRSGSDDRHSFLNRQRRRREKTTKLAGGRCWMGSPEGLVWLIENDVKSLTLHQRNHDFLA